MAEGGPLRVVALETHLPFPAWGSEVTSPMTMTG